MSKLRLLTERHFEQFGRVLIRNRIKALLLMAVLIAGSMAFLPHLTVDTKNESYFHKDDPALGDYNAFRDQFGRKGVVFSPSTRPRFSTAPF